MPSSSICDLLLAGNHLIRGTISVVFFCCKMFTKKDGNGSAGRTIPFLLMFSYTATMLLYFSGDFPLLHWPEDPSQCPAQVLMPALQEVFCGKMISSVDFFRTK